MRWCSWQYLEFSVTFLMFYLFDWRPVDLIVFSFVQGKMSQRFCALERARSASGAQFVQECLNRLIVSSIVIIFKGYIVTYKYTQMEKVSENVTVNLQESTVSPADSRPVWCSIVINPCTITIQWQIKMGP